MFTKLTVLSFAVIGTLAAATPIEAKLQLAQGFGQRCKTAQGVCSMSRPALVGAKCFCPAPSGSISGTVI